MQSACWYRLLLMSVMLATESSLTESEPSLQPVVGATKTTSFPVDVSVAENRWVRLARLLEGSCSQTKNVTAMVRLLKADSE